MKKQSNVRDALKSFGEIGELSEVVTFSGYRKDKRVTVRLLDRGPDGDALGIRFMCQVEQEDGKKAMGNAAATAAEAVIIVHWSELD